MQKWVENFAKDWIEYTFLAMPANANSIANTQCERNLRVKLHNLGKTLMSYCLYSNGAICTPLIGCLNFSLFLVFNFSFDL